MGKNAKKSSKPKFELKFTSRARTQLEQPEAKFEELLNKFEKLGIKFKELRIKLEGLGIEFKKWWTKFTKKIKSSSSQESKTQDYNLDNDNVSNYLVDYFNDTYEIYHYRNHHYEPIIYNDDKTKSTENLLEDIYADTVCGSFESETGYPVSATSNVNEGASCSKIGDKNNISPRWTSQGAAALQVNNSAEVSPIPLRRPPRPPMPTRQSIKAYRKNRNVNYNSNNNDSDYLSINGNNSEKMSHNPLQSQNKLTFPTSSINSSDHYYDTVYDSNASSPASPRLISQGSASSQVGNSEEVSSIPLKPISLPKPGDAAFWISETNSPSIPLNPTFRSIPSKQFINNSHKNENEFSLDINEGASCSKLGNAEKKVPPAIAPKPKNWNPEFVRNINNLQVNDLDLRQIRQSLCKTNHR